MTMKINLKNLNVFTVSVTLFLLILSYCMYIYYEYGKPLDLKADKKEVNVEVSLPVLEWDKYMSLSKKINLTSSMKVKRKVVENKLEESRLVPYR